ncbi:MAG: hypothetical protein ACKVU4_10850 [Phycisphaerales bacterium]
MSEHDTRPDYLWDRSGPPDPRVAALEAKLEPYRFKGGPVPGAAPAVRVRDLGWFLRRGSLIAAAVALGVAGLYLLTRPTASGWTVERVAGAPILGGREVRTASPFRPGQWLDTDPASRARVEIDEHIGYVDVDAGTRLKLVRTGTFGTNADGTPRVEHRLTLAKGRIEAFTTVPPEVFFVDTPSVTAVDYGCEYTLETDEAGKGLLSVTLGLVKLRWKDRDVEVPRGMSCHISPDTGPGTPFKTP